MNYPKMIKGTTFRQISFDGEMYYMLVSMALLNNYVGID